MANQRYQISLQILKAIPTTMVGIQSFQLERIWAGKITGNCGKKGAPFDWKMAPFTSSKQMWKNEQKPGSKPTKSWEKLRTINTSWNGVKPKVSQADKSPELSTKNHSLGSISAFKKGTTHAHVLSFITFLTKTVKNRREAFNRKLALLYLLTNHIWTTSRRRRSCMRNLRPLW